MQGGIQDSILEHKLDIGENADEIWIKKNKKSGLRFIGRHERRLLVAS